MNKLLIFRWLVTLTVSLLLSSNAFAQNNLGPSIKINQPLQADGDVLEALVSPDKQTIVYLADQNVNGVFKLFSVPIEGGAATQLTPGITNGGRVFEGYKISPDSKYVVYRVRLIADGPRELFSVPINGGGANRLSQELIEERSVFSSIEITPDSKTVVYNAQQITAGVSEIYRVSITGDNFTRLNPELVEGGDVRDLALSLAGDTIIYRADQIVDNVVELFSLPISGGASRRLNPDLVTGGDVEEIQISPDGQTLVYLADQIESGVEELFSVPLGGGIATRLNENLVSDGDVQDGFVISPDSQRVVYAADQNVNRREELFSVPIGGGAVTRLSQIVTGRDNVSINRILISPNSNKVVYVERDQLGSDLFSVPIDGGLVIPLNTGVATDVLGANRGVETRSFRINASSDRVLYTEDRITPGVSEIFSVSIYGGRPIKINRTLPSGAGRGNNTGQFVDIGSRRFVLYIVDQDTAGKRELFLQEIDILLRSSEAAVRALPAIVLLLLDDESS